MAGRVSRLWELWHYFNAKYFGGKLEPPTAIRINRSARYDGLLIYGDNWQSFDVAPVRIHIASDVAARNESATLLHEMVHQYQVQVWKVEASHDPNFQSYCRWIERQTGFKLR